MTVTTLLIGAWSVDPTTNHITRDGESVRLEARSMRLLLCLSEHAGETVSTDDLMERVWSGTIVTQDSVYQAVASLRRLLGDDPKKPTYIATVPRRGYRLVAKVTVQTDSAEAAALPPSPAGPAAHASYSKIGILAGALVAAVLAFGFWHFSSVTMDQPPISPSPSTPQSVAVLPFLDLTSEAMHEEFFADGMTEELIDRLSKVSGLRVPPPTASFYFKGKPMPLNEIAEALNVNYVVDGSVRRSGATLRIAARLIRADTGFIVWSEAYDRQSEDLLMVQDEIAGQVAKAIEASRAIEAK